MTEDEDDDAGFGPLQIPDDDDSICVLRTDSVGDRDDEIDRWAQLLFAYQAQDYQTMYWLFQRYARQWKTAAHEYWMVEQVRRMDLVFSAFLVQLVAWRFLHYSPLQCLWSSEPFAQADDVDKVRMIEIWTDYGVLDSPQWHRRHSESICLARLIALDPKSDDSLGPSLWRVQVFQLWMDYGFDHQHVPLLKHNEIMLQEYLEQKIAGLYAAYYTPFYDIYQQDADRYSCILECVRACLTCLIPVVLTDVVVQYTRRCPFVSYLGYRI